MPAPARWHDPGIGPETLLSPMTATRTPFEILGVSEDATADEVRRAYRREALRFHPDRNPGDPAAAEAFLQAQQAYRALDRRDPDAGFDAERVAAQMQRAALEAERRRSRPGEGGRAWQQARFALDRPRADHYAAVLRTRQAWTGLALALGISLAVALGLAPLLALANAWLGLGMALPPWSPAALGAAIAVGLGSRVLATSEPPPFAVETHWQGLRDLRWDVVLSWSEIRGIRQGEGVVDVALTEAAVRRLGPLVPPEAWLQPHIYQLPMRDGAPLLSIVQAQIKR